MALLSVDASGEFLFISTSNLQCGLQSFVPQGTVPPCSILRYRRFDPSELQAPPIYRHLQSSKSLGCSATEKNYDRVSTDGQEGAVGFLPPHRNNKTVIKGGLTHAGPFPTFSAFLYSLWMWNGCTFCRRYLSGDKAASFLRLRAGRQ